MFIVLICSMIALSTRIFILLAFMRVRKSVRLCCLRELTERDTLAFADVINGRFELRGRVDGAKSCLFGGGESVE